MIQIPYEKPADLGRLSLDVSRSSTFRKCVFNIAETTDVITCTTKYLTNGSFHLLTRKETSVPALKFLSTVSTTKIKCIFP